MLMVRKTLWLLVVGGDDWNWGLVLLIERMRWWVEEVTSDRNRSLLCHLDEIRLNCRQLHNTN